MANRDDLPIEPWPPLAADAPLGRREVQCREAIQASIDELLAKHFPEAKTGDIDPLTAVALDDALENMIEWWVSYNVPKES